MMTAILVNTFTPIAAYLAEIYDEDPVVINLAGLLFVLMHPPNIYLPCSLFYRYVRLEGWNHYRVSSLHHWYKFKNAY